MDHVGQTMLGVHSSKTAPVEQFFVHELDIEMTQFQCQTVTRLEQCCQENIEPLQHETHADAHSQDLHLDGGLHTANIGQL